MLSLILGVLPAIAQFGKLKVTATQNIKTIVVNDSLRK